MNTADLEKLPTNEIAEIVSAGAAILAKRAGAIAPVQFSLLPAVEAVDLTETLPDGSPRFIAVKQATAVARQSVDTLKRRILAEGIGVIVGSRYFVDRTKIARRP